MKLLHMGVAYGGAAEDAVRLQYPGNSCQTGVPVLYMVQHVIGDDPVVAFCGQFQGIRSQNNDIKDPVKKMLDVYLYTGII